MGIGGVIGCQGTSLVGFPVFVCPSSNFSSKQATHLKPFHRPAAERQGPSQQLYLATEGGLAIPRKRHNYI
jgi:hypothetical protein